MAELTPEQAIQLFTELSMLIHAGAYQERDHEGNYGEDGIEEGLDNVIDWAARQGLAFIWHEDTQAYTLEPVP